MTKFPSMAGTQSLGSEPESRGRSGTDNWHDKTMIQSSKSVQNINSFSVLTDDKKLMIFTTSQNIKMTCFCHKPTAKTEGIDPRMAATSRNVCKTLATDNYCRVIQSELCESTTLRRSSCLIEETNKHIKMTWCLTLGIYDTERTRISFQKFKSIPSSTEGHRY